MEHLISPIATIAAILVAALALWIGMKQFKEQVRLNFFTDYTKRYQEIMINLPHDIGDPDFDIHALDPEQREQILRYMRAYFDLCSEEYHQYQKKRIDQDTWNEWEEGIKYSFSKRAFRDGWEELTFNSKYYGDFVSLAEKVQDKESV